MGIINELEILKEEFGEDITLGSLIEKVRGDKIYKCPSCKGTGKVEVSDKSCVNEYGFIPPRGWKQPMKIVNCDVCHGEGYTSKKLVPKTQVIGYVVEE